LDDDSPQKLLPPPAYLCAWIASLTGLIFVPTHFLLKKIRNPATL
jgi:hypothetical protein